MSDLWSGYYRTGDVHSSVMEFTPDARERIADRWRAMFAELPSGSSILDLGTGGGALPSLARETTDQSHTLALTGVDLARSRPEDAPRSTPHCTIEYRGGVDFSQLPFEDRSFDAVVTQFAIEYGDLSRILWEAARVASRQFAALIHARDGAVVRQNGPIADQVDWLIKDLGIIEVLRHHVQRPNFATEQQLKTAAAEIRKAGARLENPSFLEAVAQNIGRFLAQQHQYETREKIRLLSGFEEALLNHAERMRALARAARDREELENACSVFAVSGFSGSRCEPQRSNGDQHLVGYWLLAHR